MKIGCYYANGDCYVGEPDEVMDKLGITKYLLNKTLNGEHVIPGVILVKVPSDTPYRR